MLGAVVGLLAYSVTTRWERLFEQIRLAERDATKIPAEIVNVRSEYDVCGKLLVHREERRNVSFLNPIKKTVWDSERALALYLQEKDGCGTSGSRRILEVGAGLGLLGMWRAYTRPGATVLLTDVDKGAVQMMKDAVKENQMAAQVKVEELHWNDKEQLRSEPKFWEENFHFDEVVAADVVHGATDTNALLEFLVSLRHPKLVIWLMTEHRKALMITDFADTSKNIEIPWTMFGGRKQGPKVKSFFEKIKRWYKVENVQWQLEAPNAWAEISRLRAERRGLLTDEGLLSWARQGTLELKKLTSRTEVPDPPPKRTPTLEEAGVARTPGLAVQLPPDKFKEQQAKEEEEAEKSATPWEHRPWEKKKKKQKQSVNTYWDDNDDEPIEMEEKEWEF